MFVVLQVRPPITSRVIGNVGRLCAYGRRMDERYGTLTTKPAPQTSRPLGQLHSVCFTMSTDCRRCLCIRVVSNSTHGICSRSLVASMVHVSRYGCFSRYRGWKLLLRTKDCPIVACCRSCAAACLSTSRCSLTPTISSCAPMGIGLTLFERLGECHIAIDHEQGTTAPRKELDVICVPPDTLRLKGSRRFDVPAAVQAVQAYATHSHQGIAYTIPCNPTLTVVVMRE
ncbi:uncharacterized protein K489DRAFT_192307 [Dissoconium aciculare CBS 342.82]|uniref:Uncharacterized protein n=1 Tax=Dissoconium aciculare CBS 342.82 TaxID=1314786 RepID=A0A6J3M5H2_9PEZI|nr:uncharacterized protein K489DRAFT_192307 [Dissoconium aciculare CBS 342.82]KAF1823311.1 hypothetical protein K489DRAFT_192307 [Dissoconium aciculare CBS 342.82]